MSSELAYPKKNAFIIYLNALKIVILLVEYYFSMIFLALLLLNSMIAVLVDIFFLKLLSFRNFFLRSVNSS